jgi:hypothetical protein
MKRSRLFLAIVVAISLISAPSFAAVKAGAKCTKAGATSTTGGKKYTCVKSGSKLVWNKGVAVKAAAKPELNPVFKPVEPTPSPTPTPNQTPSISIPANNAICTKLNEEVTTSDGMFKCQLRSDGQLFWSKNNPPPGGSTQTPTPAPTSEAKLPAEGSVCQKIGDKIQTSFGYMRCNWPGGAISTGTWRSFYVKKLSTSASNNYKTTPVAMAACENSGDTFDVSGGYLECRFVAGKKLQWIKINTVKQGFVNAVSPQGIDVCKLKNADAVAGTGRDDKRAGFPRDVTKFNGMKPKGVNEVLIVGIDFPELRGGSGLSAKLAEEAKWLKDWYRYFSNDQAKFNVSTVDYWINSPRSALSYVKTGNDGNSASSNRFLADASQPFIDLITKEVDLRKYSTVYMMFPEGETTFDMDLIVRNERFNVKEGQINLNFFGWGHDMELQEALHWAFYVHETLHDFDIIGHAPGNGWPFGVFANQAGVSMAMNPYEQFLVDWLPENQIYCQDVATLTKSTISLTPLEREDKQTKMAIIKLSPTKAIVIESHGIDKWSSFNTGDRSFPAGFYSIMAYVVDLNKAVAPPVTADQRSLSNQDYAWAVWARVEGGKSTEYPYFPAAFGEDIYSAVAVLGDSFLIEGIRIKFVATGDYETIEISKA